MNDQTKSAALGAVAGMAGILALLGVAGLALVYTGAYNVAATEEHASLTRWAFDTTQQNSVERRAADIAAPANFSPDMIEAGAISYKTMCQHCHAGPGVERASWASGMRPRPPHLTERAAEWKPREIFWLLKHGVKMSGMPAFGPTHDDQTLWNMSAFVKELPAMTAERYAAFGGKEGHGGGQRQSGEAPPGSSPHGTKPH